jgi:hypothetical protein
VFATAAERFKEQLTLEDRINFEMIGNAEEMITSIETQIGNLNSHRTSRLLEACKKIDRFGKAMSPFFKITDIFVSSHPDWAAIVWGAIRLVFQVRTFQLRQENMPTRE